MTVEEIVNSWNVQLEQDATTFTNEAVKVCARTPVSPLYSDYCRTMYDMLELFKNRSESMACKASFLTARPIVDDTYFSGLKNPRRSRSRRAYVILFYYRF